MALLVRSHRIGVKLFGSLVHSSELLLSMYVRHRLIPPTACLHLILWVMYMVKSAVEGVWGRESLRVFLEVFKGGGAH